jgi:hypothetical protein
MLFNHLNEVITNPSKRKPKPISTGHPAKSIGNSAWRFVRDLLIRDHYVLT